MIDEANADAMIMMLILDQIIKEDHDDDGDAYIDWASVRQLCCPSSLIKKMMMMIIDSDDE